MFKTIKNVFRHGRAIFPRKVNIKIRWVGPVEVNESLKIEVKFHGVHIGYAKEVGHNTIRTTATAYIKETSSSCFGNNIPIN